MKKEDAKRLLSKIIEGYNKNAQEFSDSRSHIWPETLFLFDRYIEKKDKVLDLGCGNGRYYNIIKKKGAQYLGIDKSKKLIEIAKKVYPEGDFQIGDALNLPFDDNSFDKIFSIAVFHQIPSKKLRFQFLKEARRVLKKEGLLFLTVWQPQKSFPSFFKYIIKKVFFKSPLDYRDILWSGWNKKVTRYYHIFSKRELKKVFRKAGFKILEIGEIKDKKRKRFNLYVVSQKPR